MKHAAPSRDHAPASGAVAKYVLCALMLAISPVHSTTPERENFFYSKDGSWSLTAKRAKNRIEHLASLVRSPDVEDWKEFGYQVRHRFGPGGRETTIRVWNWDVIGDWTFTGSAREVDALEDDPMFMVADDEELELVHPTTYGWFHLQLFRNGIPSYLSTYQVNTDVRRSNLVEQVYIKRYDLSDLPSSPAISAKEAQSIGYETVHLRHRMVVDRILQVGESKLAYVWGTNDKPGLWTWKPVLVWILKYRFVTSDEEVYVEIDATTGQPIDVPHDRPKRREWER